MCVRDIYTKAASPQSTTDAALLQEIKQMITGRLDAVDSKLASEMSSKLIDRDYKIELAELKDLYSKLKQMNTTLKEDIQGKAMIIETQIKSFQKETFELIKTESELLDILLYAQGFNKNDLFVKLDNIQEHSIDKIKSQESAIVNEIKFASDQGKEFVEEIKMLMIQNANNTMQEFKIVKDNANSTRNWEYVSNSMDEKRSKKIFSKKKLEYLEKIKKGKIHPRLNFD